jgi:hypothetical protein
MTESEAVPMSDHLKYGLTTDNGDLMSNCYVHTCSGNRKSCAKGKGRTGRIYVVTESYKFCDRFGGNNSDKIRKTKNWNKEKLEP